MPRHDTTGLLMVLCFYCILFFLLCLLFSFYIYSSRVPLNTGFLFSRNARVPSFASLLATQRAKASLSNLHPVSRSRLLHSIDSFAARRDTLPLLVSVSAHFKTSSIRDSGEITLLTSPYSRALEAGKVWPVKISSLARFGPTIFASLCVPPKPGIRPRVDSGSPNTAFSDA